MARLPQASGKVFFFVLSAALVVSLPAAAQQPQKGASTGWVCGLVTDDTFSLVADAELLLYPKAKAEEAREEAREEAKEEPVARVTSDEHGSFCFEGLEPGFYELRASKEPWPVQPRRTVEVRAGLVNRLTSPVELELEPGGPSISFPKSFDGMSDVEARGVMERLLAQGDTASIEELARRLLPKRGVRIDLNRIVLGLDVKPLVEELMRQVRRGYLPPRKTARYLYCLGELADVRTMDAVTQVLLRRLRDGRLLPPDPYTGETSTGYVSDYAMYALERVAGERFDEWEYGKPPIQNRKGILAAQNWWQRELDERRRDR